MDDDFSAITLLLKRYFDGLHHGDTAILRQVFHPQAGYYTVAEGELLHLDMARYFQIVDARPSPASQGHARTDGILSIDVAGPTTALARVRCSIPPRHFVDFLSLLKLDGQWWIVSKVFHCEQP